MTLPEEISLGISSRANLYRKLGIGEADALRMARWEIFRHYGLDAQAQADYESDLREDSDGTFR